ncbi:Ig domain-containing protein group 1 domain-containing protein [Halobacteriales archaeon QS_1_68_20]|nr:MAG: Ig domain-containing protein group 1 domain-containing protein [Halobacteriales archaeon QS_1_68_20]
MPSLIEDDRAIEGLPIRLVIALVVGVASLGVMMNMLGGIQGLTVEELDAKPQPEVVTAGEETVTLQVVDTSGNPVSDATVVVSGGTATLSEIRTASTGPNGTAEVTIDPALGPNQDQGTLSVEIKPPAGSQYADERGNTEILVIREGE